MRAVPSIAPAIVGAVARSTRPPPTVSTQSVDEFSYSQTDTGAEVTFKQFGADYLVQFECKRPDETQSCINEAEARGVVHGARAAGAYTNPGGFQIDVATLAGGLS